MTVQEMEEEMELATKVSERLEKLKRKQPEYFKNQEAIFKAFEQLEQEFIQHLEAERKFLESLPQLVQKRIEKDKAILELRKQVLELLKSME